MSIPANYIQKDFSYAPNHGIIYSDAISKQAEEKSKFKVQKAEKASEDQAQRTREEEENLKTYSRSAMYETGNSAGKGHYLDYFV